MRASTLFALTLALLIGLSVAVGVRWMGAGVKPPEEKKKKETQVLVAARNLFPGDVIETSWVTTRAMKPEEETHYEANKALYLPATVNAVSLRVARKTIEADVPILRDDLKELVKPEPLSVRLLPNMRALNVSIPKEHSAGGLIQVGEWVDVLMTSTITSPAGQDITRTAAIAHRCRVIAKRNALWNIFAALPEDKPVQFTLEVNPYRAALIEYCKPNATLALAPLSISEQRVLEEKRTKLLSVPVAQLQPVLFQEPRLGDYDQEESRVEAINRGEYTVGNSDLVRIFDLKTPPPPTAEIKVEHFSGLERSRTTQYGSDGVLLASVDERRNRQVKPGADPNSTINGFRFKCPTCDKNKKKAHGQ